MDKLIGERRDDTMAATEEDERTTIPFEVAELALDGMGLVRAWREHLGLTQDEVAARMGITRPAYAKMEKPDAHPRHATLKKIAAALGVEPAQLKDN